MASEFVEELSWLRRQFEPIGLSELRQWTNGDWRKPKPPLLITFDDGYRNNLQVAAPILLKQDCPAVFFLATGYIGTDRMLWTDEVGLRVRRWPDATIQLPNGRGQEVQQQQVPAALAERTELVRQVKQSCKNLAALDRAEYLEYLRARLPGGIPVDDAEARAFMSWDDARRLANMGFDIGSHTAEHFVLAGLDRAVLRGELRRSKQTIEQKIGRKCIAIAYPNGRSQDVDAMVLDEVRAAGYSYGFMGTPGWQPRRGDPLQILRNGAPGHQNLDTFLFYAIGLRGLSSRSGRNVLRRPSR